MRCSLIALLGLLVVAGCESTAPHVHSDAVSASDAAMIRTLSKLAGDWEMTDEKGERHRAATFAVTSGGSAVREIMFPGEAHEMTNLYHMDGSALVCTHYCAAGNQPRMVASRPVESDEGTTFHFEFDSVSNPQEPRSLHGRHDPHDPERRWTPPGLALLRPQWESHRADDVHARSSSVSHHRAHQTSRPGAQPRARDLDSRPSLAPPHREEWSPSAYPDRSTG